MECFAKVKHSSLFSSQNWWQRKKFYNFNYESHRYKTYCTVLWDQIGWNCCSGKPFQPSLMLDRKVSDWKRLARDKHSSLFFKNISDKWNFFKTLIPGATASKEETWNSRRQLDGNRQERRKDVDDEKRNLAGPGSDRKRPESGKRDGRRIRCRNVRPNQPTR